jgi:hypothetical protein
MHIIKTITQLTVGLGLLFGHKQSHLKFEIHERTVKISTRQVQKEMGDGTLNGSLLVTSKPHLRVIKLLQTNPF